MLEAPTRFAPAERAPKEDVDRQAAALQGVALLKEVLATVPDLVLVVNPERQIVFANHALAEFVHQPQEDIVGRRPGELLGCVNSFNLSGGCGTSEACRSCGLLTAILASAEGREAQSEARLSSTSGDSHDLQVTSSRITVGDDHMTVVTLTDIAHEKRRRVLERVFFHDVLNTAGGMRGLVGLIKEAKDEQVDTITDMLESSAAQLVDEIKSQWLLTSVEGDEYEPTMDLYSVPRLVFESVGTFVPLGRAGDVAVEVGGNLPDMVIETDRTMMGRVLGNLIKNAIEASTAGMTVRVGARLTEGDAEFWVHNETAIPRESQLQIFQRSFSTKGSARGLGTYSVKLFAERYLGGRVSFESHPETGTTFHVFLPLFCA